eukprot:Opistho-2@33433
MVSSVLDTIVLPYTHTHTANLQSSVGSANASGSTRTVDRMGIPTRLGERAKQWCVDVKNNFNLNEISGAFGDMGTFMPLLVGLVAKNGLNFGSAMFFAGTFNIITGMFFDIPMTVQPMKAIAAAAIKEDLPLGQIYAAGITTSVVVGLLGLTGLINVFNKWIPMPVIRGVQLGLGLGLVNKGIQMVVGTNTWTGADSIPVGIACYIAIALLWYQTVIPTALVLFVVGIVISAVKGHHSVHVGGWDPSVQHLTWDDFKKGFTSMALSQIPMTTLNSVLAVCRLSSDLFPSEKAARPVRVSMSVAAMNIIGCWFGAMPMCHGAGGLAAQYRFGARTNVSILFLGSVFVLVAVILGDSLFSIMQTFPNSVLGAMLAVGGLELCTASRDVKTKDEAVVLFVTACTVMTQNTFQGCVAGLACHVLLILAAKLPLRGEKPECVAPSASGAVEEGSGGAHVVNGASEPVVVRKGYTKLPGSARDVDGVDDDALSGGAGSDDVYFAQTDLADRG